MEKMNVCFIGDYSEAPNELELVATLDDVKLLRELHESLKPFKDKIWSVNVNVMLYDVPEDCDWRHDVDHVIMYVSDREEIFVYQYFQNKYDASDQIETDAISLDELEKYLKEKENAEV